MLICVAHSENFFNQTEKSAYCIDLLIRAQNYPYDM